MKLTGELELNVGKGIKVSASKEFLGEDDTCIKGHIDIPASFAEALSSGSLKDGAAAMLGIGHECSYEFKPWDDSMEEIEEMEETIETDPTAATYEAILTIEGITLSEISVHLDKGQTRNVSVTGLPEGYKPGDLVAVSDNPEIATLNVKEGVIYAGSAAGSTLITVKTSDGKYSTEIGVTVYDDTVQDFQGLTGGKVI